MKLQYRGLAALALVAGALGAFTLGDAARAQNEQNESQGDAQGTTERARPRGRLPAYYTSVISEEQREQIYDIQQKYQPELDELRAKLREVVEKRDAEVEQILTPEQREKVAKLRDEARQRRNRPDRGDRDGSSARDAAAASE